MTPFRYETFKGPTGYGYRIFDGDELIVGSRPGFWLERDAEATGKHFASDPDLKILIANRK